MGAWRAARGDLAAMFQLRMTHLQLQPEHRRVDHLEHLCAQHRVLRHHRANVLIHHRIRESGERQRMDLRMRLGVSHPKLLRVVGLMETSLAEPLGSQELADAVQLSTRQLERLFLKYLGRSPAEEIRRVRLEHARNLIRQTAMPLLSVAFECGFTSASHFSKAYLDCFGQPPSAERKLVQTPGSVRA